MNKALGNYFNNDNFQFPNGFSHILNTANKDLMFLVFQFPNGFSHAC